MRWVVIITAIAARLGFPVQPGVQPARYYAEDIIAIERTETSSSLNATIPSTESEDA